MIGQEGTSQLDNRQIVDTRVIREEPFPEDPQARFEAIFAAIGNSEAKCATLLSLNSAPQTEGELHSEFMRRTGRAWETHEGIQAKYCNLTLAPIGLVATADTLFYGSSEYRTGYRLTQAGKELGQPIAAFLLKQSLGFPYSLTEIFGPTATRGKTRSIINRIRLLELLLEKGELKIGDIDKLVMLNTDSLGGGSERNLSELRALGFIDFSSINTGGKETKSFSINHGNPDSDVRPVGWYRTLTEDVIEVIGDLESVSAKSVVLELKKRHPQGKFHRTGVSIVLAELTRRGILKTNFMEASKSRVVITEQGAELLSKLITPIRKALTPEGSELLEEWGRIPWEAYAKEAVVRHREKSGNANQRSIQEQAVDYLQIILDRPGIRPKEMAVQVGKFRWQALALLLEHGLVRKEREGTTVRYFPT